MILTLGKWFDSVEMVVIVCTLLVECRSASTTLPEISLDKRDTAAGCILGTYSCDIENSQILVCDNDQYWELVEVCRGSRTCRNSPDGILHCVGFKVARDVTI